MYMISTVSDTVFVSCDLYTLWVTVRFMKVYLWAHFVLCDSLVNEHIVIFVLLISSWVCIRHCFKKLSNDNYIVLPNVQMTSQVVAVKMKSPGSHLTD